MKKVISTFCVFISFFGHSQSSGTVINSVSLPAFSLMDIEPNNSTLVLHFDEPTEAGLLNTTKTISGQKWINYTSALAASDYRSITVQKSFGNIPSGIRLFVGSDAAIGGFGELGVTAGFVRINNSPKTIIDNIGSAYTTSGATGHSLNYKIEINNMSQLDADETTDIGLTFDIVDNQNEGFILYSNFNDCSLYW